MSDTNEPTEQVACSEVRCQVTGKHRRHSYNIMDKIGRCTGAVWITSKSRRKEPR